MASPHQDLPPGRATRWPSAMAGAMAGAMAAAVVLVACCMAPARATPATDEVSVRALGDAVALCLLSASGPTVVDFKRSASVQPCRDAEHTLARLYRRANRFRQLACSGSPSLLALQTDLLLISIHGGTAELAGLALGRIDTIRRTCWDVEPFR